jgi:hypothetical protein
MINTFSDNNQESKPKRIIPVTPKRAGDAEKKVTGDNKIKDAGGK